MTRKTKIICTLGPASSDKETVRELIQNGMDVARINFSHGDDDMHRALADNVKELRRELGTHTALLMDTKGPEVRVKTFAEGQVTLTDGQLFRLCTYDTEGTADKVSITYTGLPRDISVGTRILIDDGLIEMHVENFDEREIVCRVITGGTVKNRKGINIPSVKLSIPFLSDADKADIAFAVKEDFDFIAASFTQCAQDVRDIRAHLESLGCHNMRIIAKIENAAGVENADEIIHVADGIMVARGDMGVEIPMEDIPPIQKSLIKKCYVAGKQVITATQMLESMHYHTRPTRAEITDVANAIYDGTSAIMLSGETAAGKYPIESVRMMARIALRAESDIDYKSRFQRLNLNGFSNVTNAISHATCTTAHDLHASAIITVTKSGGTARKLSRFRPETPIIGCSPEEKTCRHMNMSWGITPILMREMTSTDELLEAAVSEAYEKGYVSYGDLVVITAGIPLGISGTTNMLKVQIVGNVLVSGTGIGSSVCGTLCVCTNEREALANFRDGEILVLPDTSRNIIDLIRRASGIICERDGEDSYAAIVGQALGIPVVYGAVGATKILKSGTTVILDGASGTVFSGR